MSEEKEKKEEEGKGDAPKSKKKLFLIIGVVLLVAVIGIGAFFTMGGKSSGEHGDEEAAEEEHGEGEEGEEGALPPAVMPLEPFIVNLTVRGAFLKTTIQLEFSEPEIPHHVENEIAKIRDVIIRILSGKTANEILAGEGKETLRTQIKQAVNGALGGEDVTGVYFTEFIIQ